MPVTIVPDAQWRLDRQTGPDTWEEVLAWTGEWSSSRYSDREEADVDLRRIVTGENLPAGTYRLTISTSADVGGSPITDWTWTFPEPEAWAKFSVADRSFAHNVLAGGWVGESRRRYVGVTREQVAQDLDAFSDHAADKIDNDELARRTGYEWSPA